MMSLGCSEANHQTLVEALRTPASEGLISIEQIDVDVRQGRPDPAFVISAKALKTVVEKETVSNFAQIISRADKERHHANHPISLGNVVLRAKVKDGFYIVYCELLELGEVQYCSLRVGGKNEANINKMKSFESKELIKWLSVNEIKPR